MMRTTLPLLCLPLLVSLAEASPKPWMEVRGDPERLPVYIFELSVCPNTIDEVRDIIHDSLRRARLEMVEDTHAELQLWFKMQCVHLSETSENYLFNIEVDFGSWSEALGHFRLGESSYGTFGVNDESFIVDAIGDAVDKALTDYIEVNFDL